METRRCEGWAWGCWALATHRGESPSRPCRGFRCVCVLGGAGVGCGGVSWLLCTQLRTWLDGPASLSPGTWRGACSMMSPPSSHPGPVLRGGLAHCPARTASPAGTRRGQRRAEHMPAITPRGMGAPPGTLCGGSQTSIEVTPIAKERMCHPQDQGQARGAVVSAGGPQGLITSSEISLKSLILSQKCV